MTGFLNMRRVPPDAGDTAWVSFDGRCIGTATVTQVHQEATEGHRRTSFTLQMDDDPGLSLTVSVHRQPASVSRGTDAPNLGRERVHVEG